MIAIGRNLTGLTLGILGMASFAILAFGLVFLRLPPLMVGALVVGGAIVAVSAFRPYLGVHVMLGLVFFEGAFRVMEDVTVTKIVGGLITAGWLAHTLTQRRLREVFNLQTILVAVYLAWCALSVTQALDPGLAANRLMSYVLLGLSMTMIGSVVDTPRRMVQLLFALVCWTTIASVIALAMYYAGTTGVASGLVGNRNLLAAYINTGAIAALLMYPLLRGGLPRVVLMVAVPVLLLSLALTLSRTGLIVMLFMIVSVWYRLVRERGFLVLLGSTLVCVALIFLLPGQFWRRAGTILPSIERQEDTFGMRVRLWSIGLRVISDAPLLGVGPGNFVQASIRYTPAGVAGRRLVTHNTYVGTAAETGLVGMALFLAVVASAMLGARRAVHAARQVGRSDLALAGITVEMMMLAIMLSAITMNMEGHKILWIGLGLCVAFIAVVRTTVAAEAGRAVPVFDEAVRGVTAT